MAALGTGTRSAPRPSWSMPLSARRRGLLHDVLAGRRDVPRHDGPAARVVRFYTNPDGRERSSYDPRVLGLLPASTCPAGLERRPRPHLRALATTAGPTCSCWVCPVAVGGRRGGRGADRPRHRRGLRRPSSPPARASPSRWPGCCRRTWDGATLGLAPAGGGGETAFRVAARRSRSSYPSSCRCPRRTSAVARTVGLGVRGDRLDLLRRC